MAVRRGEIRGKVFNLMGKYSFKIGKTLAKTGKNHKFQKIPKRFGEDFSKLSHDFRNEPFDVKLSQVRLGFVLDALHRFGIGFSG